jgi:hypothetical protein
MLFGSHFHVKFRHLNVNSIPTTLVNDQIAKATASSMAIMATECHFCVAVPASHASMAHPLIISMTVLFLVLLSCRGHVCLEMDGILYRGHLYLE